MKKKIELFGGNALKRDINRKEKINLNDVAGSTGIEPEMLGRFQKNILDFKIDQVSFPAAEKLSNGKIRIGDFELKIGSQVFGYDFNLISTEEEDLEKIKGKVPKFLETLDIAGISKERLPDFLAGSLKNSLIKSGKFIDASGISRENVSLF